MDVKYPEKKKTAKTAVFGANNPKSNDRKSGIIDVYGFPVVEARIDERYTNIFSDIGVFIKVVRVAHPDYKMFVVEADDPKTGKHYEFWGDEIHGDKINDTMDRVNEQIKQDRS